MNNDTDFYPITASADGHKNAYHLDNCDVVGHRPPFAACLFKIEEWRARRLGVAGPVATCGIAMDRGTCPAMLMRQEEVTAGKAIYFIDRVTMQREMKANEESAVGRASVKQTRAAPPVPASSLHKTDIVPKKILSLPEIDESEGDNGYAAAINMAMADMPSPVPKPIAFIAPVNTGVAKAGMSMVEIARAALAQAKH